MPAALCGVIGYKPAYGTVPVVAPYNLDTYLQNGPMGRTVEDVLLMQRIIAGPDWSDPASFGAPPALPAAAASVTGLRVAVSADLGGWPVDAEVRQATLRTAALLAAAGAEVETVDLRLPPGDVLRAASIHYSLSFGEIDRLVEEHRDRLTPGLVAAVEGHRRRSAGGTVPEMHGLEARLWDAAAAVLRGHEVLLCPTMGTSDVLADLDYAGADGVEVDGRTWYDLLEVALTVPFSLLGRCPVLAVPSGRNRNGVPMGVQLVGRPYEEEPIFKAATVLQSAGRWFSKPALRPAELVP
jgi:Asp-tRNA(Asn)/Glu-tRNA(Gln) amidotransferase A subunit family amidase